MSENKTKIATAIILALLLAFSIFGISYILFPGQASQQSTIPTPISKPEPLSDQLFWTIQWIGLAAFVAISAVGALLLVNRARHR